MRAEYRLQIKKVLRLKHWDKQRQKPKRRVSRFQPRLLTDCHASPAGGRVKRRTTIGSSSSKIFKPDGTSPCSMTRRNDSSVKGPKL